MLPFEDMIADYVKETGNHVLYRVTPVFEGNNLVASGVQMEARSIEDNGEGILFNVYAYNDQPGITIDYATGESHLATGSENGATGSVSESGTTATVGTFILNRNTKKFHRPTCSSVKAMKEENKEERTQDSGTLASEGYAPCKNCNP
ncbi:MAG: DNA/RNA non-specific endonuclease, partial [Anaerovoracaceae bacterium]